MVQEVAGLGGGGWTVARERRRRRGGGGDGKMMFGGQGGYLMVVLLSKQTTWSCTAKSHTRCSCVNGSGATSLSLGNWRWSCAQCLRKQHEARKLGATVAPSRLDPDQLSCERDEITPRSA
jgi:hypothetical protein